MNTQQFKEKDFRGRSFKGQDLTGADFSDCDLRGVDFSGATLTGAKFCHAKMGRTHKAQGVMFLLQLLFGFISGLLNFGSFAFLTALIRELLRGGNLNESEYLLGATVCNVLFLGSAVWLSLQRKCWDYTLWSVAVIGAFVAVGVAIEAGAASLDLGFVTIVEALALIIAIAFSVILALAVVGTGTFALAGAGTGIVASSGALVLAGALTVKLAQSRTLFVMIVLFVTVAAFILLETYLVRRAVKWEEGNLGLIRHLFLKINTLFCTRFAFATLHGADFSDTDLKGANFKDGHLLGCRFQGVKNHHLAMTYGTPLAPRKVRELVVNGVATEKNFHGLDLQGLDFSGLDLRGFNFANSNLSFANFSGCDLRNASLSEVTALGTNFSNAQMTGTCIHNWNIETETVLDDIDCQYYFYQDEGQQKRMPPEGETYHAGEFTRIFQKIANTIDFIAHNEIELAAIKLSVEKVRVESGNDEIRVQTVEEKDGFIVVKVVAPKTEDRGVLYQEVNTLKQEYETKIQVLMAESHAKIGGFQSNIEILKEQLKEQRQGLLAAIESPRVIQIGHVQEVSMGHKVTITGSTISGVLNLGEINGGVTQTIQHLPSEQGELKALLLELQTLIAQLPINDQQEALAETKKLAELSTQPKEEQQGTVRKTVRYFKGLAADLTALPEIGTKLGVLAAQIAALYFL